jgi:DNA replication protein DnaC
MKRLGEVIGDLRSVPRGTPAGGASRASEAETKNGDCPICKGAGWLRNDVPIGHPLFGRAIPCECLLVKREEREFEELLSFSKLDPFEQLRFETFDRSLRGVDTAYQAAKKFAEDPRGWLVLVGTYGCGKTHLAAAIANEAIRRRFRALFVVVPELLDHLRSTFGPSSDISYDELFEQVRSVPLLLLDDLGTESATPWAQEKLYQIFNRRYNLQLPTVVTSNRSLDMIDERIRSRMCDRALSKIVEIKAGSYRLKEPGERRFRDSAGSPRGRRLPSGV